MQYKVNGEWWVYLNAITEHCKDLKADAYLYTEEKPVDNNL